jgi:hypothetical protein
MVRPKLVFLRWRIKVRSRWTADDHMFWVAIFLLPFAYFVPQHLIKVDHHPPVGTYIAILGGLAAAVTFRKEPPLREKSAWIALITLLMVAEIRNLYIADKEQASTFSAIRGGLEDTKKGLDITVASLKHAAISLQGISGKITETETNSQKHFDTTIETTKEVLKKTEEAANEAEEGVNNITGGDSWGSVSIVNLVDEPNLLGFSVKNEGNRYGLRGISLAIVGYNGGGFPLLNCNGVGDIAPGMNTSVIHSCYVQPNQNARNEYEIYINALNGTTRESLSITRAGGWWKTEASVYRVLPDKKEVFLKKF